MIVVKFKKHRGRAKNLISRHEINFVPLNAKSYSASILLKDFYKKEQKADLARIEAFKPKTYTDGCQNTNKYDWRYYYIVRRHFLRSKKKEHGGHWVCHYCGEPVYNIQIRGKKNQGRRRDCITVDHIHPTSKGGPKLDTKNMVECCYSCNQEKKNMPYRQFLIQKMKKSNQKFLNAAVFCYISFIFNKLKQHRNEYFYNL